MSLYLIKGQLHVDPVHLYGGLKVGDLKITTHFNIDSGKWDEISIHQYNPFRPANPKERYDCWIPATKEQITLMRTHLLIEGISFI